MWKSTGRTLAPESRHIVGFQPISTISRSADCFLSLWLFPAYPTAICVAGGQRWILSGVSAELRYRREQGATTMMWTDERVELLKKLWADGLSASQIAAELGGITRNAVIGKVHRLGLSGRAKSPSSASPRPRKTRAHPHMLRAARPVMRGNTALAPVYDYDVDAEPEHIDNVIPIGQRRSILELTEETCRWPIGDPGGADFFFCGAQPPPGLPSCEYHSRIAYHPASARRRDRRPPVRS